MNRMKINDFLCEDIDSSWDKCLKVWNENGRIEDLPRNVRVPKYQPSFGKLLGVEFARVFKDQYKFIIGRLYSNNEIEYLCAFECLEFMCWEFGHENIPKDIFNISLPLPHKIKEEIKGDADARNFTGENIGEFLRFKFLEEFDNN